MENFKGIMKKANNNWKVREELLSDGSIAFNVTNGDVIIHAVSECSADILAKYLNKHSID
jgi:hypothetical protein